MPRGMLWSQCVRPKSSLIYVLVEIGLCCAVELAKTLVSDGIMVAALGAKQHAKNSPGVRISDVVEEGRVD